MQLSKLQIVNFRNHSSTVLNLNKKINSFIGPNAAGKSSIIDAISFLLTGTTEKMDRKGANMDELITFGESRALVAGNVNGMKVTRTIPHTFQIGTWEGTMTAQIDKFYQDIGLDKGKILCAIYSNEFIEMEPSEQKNFIFNLMGFKFNNDIMKEEFESWCKMNSIENIQPMWEYICKDNKLDGSAEILDEMYEKYSSTRKLLKREIKILEGKEAEIKSVLPEGYTVEHRDTVIAKLTKLNVSKSELLQQLGSARVMDSTKKLLQDTISRGNGIKMPDESLDILKSNLADMREKYQKNTKELTKLEYQLKDCNTSYKNLGDFDGKCQISSKVKCKITKDEIEAIRTELKKESDSLTLKIDTSKQEKNNIQTQIDTISIKLEQLTKASIILPQIEKAKTDLAKLEKQSIESVDVLHNKLQQIETSITKGQTILNTIEAESYNIKARHDAKTQHEKRMAELQIIEYIVEAFGPKGIKSSVLNRIIKPVEITVNEKMNVLTNGQYTINFRVDDAAFNIYVISNGIERKIQHLSTSEKLRVGIIMQYAINSLTGAKFIAIDNVDMLDSNNKKFFWQFIKAIKEEYETILFFTTSTETKIINMPDVNIFHISANTVQTVDNVDAF